MGLRRKIPVSVVWLSLTETETTGKRYIMTGEAMWTSAGRLLDKVSEMSV